MLVVRLAAIAAIATFLGLAALPAQAVSMTECSTMYKSAQSSGTLNGMSWNDFRKAKCGPTAAVTTAPAAPAATSKSAPATTSPQAKALAPATAAGKSEPTASNTENAAEPPATKMAPPKGVVFPTAVSPKYSSETPGKARMHTCLDQYKQNKANNALGGLSWIEKGGGYYSICNTKLKG